MQVTVEFTAQIRRAAGVSQEQVEVLDGSTVADLIIQIANQHGDDLKRLLVTDNGSPQPTLLAFVRDQQVRWAEPDVLQPADVVTLLSPISGG